jgi:dTDP-4-dehydrorhamnose reductase
MHKGPILVTGLAGVPGFAHFNFFRSNHIPVVGVRPKRKWNMNLPGAEGADVEDLVDALPELYRRHGFCAVVDASGNCALKNCEHNYDMAWNLNGLQGLIIADFCATHSIPLIRFSTDHVYSGSDPLKVHLEEDLPDYVTKYGKSMAQAEQEILQCNPYTVILRIALPMSYSWGGHAGAVDWIENRFKKNNKATLYYDEIRNSAYSRDICNVTLEILNKGMIPGGIYHCGGPRALSLYEIAQVINLCGAYDPELLVGCPRLEAGPFPPRAGNLQMDSSKLWNALGSNRFLRAWPEREDLVPTDVQWHKHSSLRSEITKNSIELFLV